MAGTRAGAANERLSRTDLAYLSLDTATTPQHLGGLSVFAAPPGGVDYDRALRLLDERLALVPRYRRRIRSVPMNLASPVWVDDPAFDLDYHVRRSALPRPGSDAALLEFCARVLARQLDRDRPLWELYLIEGLAGDRFAVLTKTHEAMVDELGAIDLMQVLLDAGPHPRRTLAPVWVPAADPGSARLVRDATLAAARRPADLLAGAGRSVRDARRVLGRLPGAAGRATELLPARPQRHPGTSPLRARVTQRRRLAVARTSLADYRQVHRASGGTVHDVALAVLTGALRAWLLERGAELSVTTTARALVPVSVSSTEPGGEAGMIRSRSTPSGGRTVSGRLVDLPVGEPDAWRRLTRVRFATASHASSAASVGADTLVALRGFAPPTLLALGARAANELTRRAYDVVIANAPGPQEPRFAAGARMLESFPLLPLSEGHAMAIALSSYDGGVDFGITADPDAVPDVAALPEMIGRALAELVAAAAERPSGAPAFRRAVHDTGTARTVTQRARTGQPADE